LPKNYDFCLKEIPLPLRAKSQPVSQLMEIEGQKLLSLVPANSLIIALDEHGQEWQTITLAKKLATWHSEQRDISLLVGGPDGLAKSILKKASIIWSLSQLTLPHQLVRVIVAEQIYRAWSIINNHPYHRI
jgi:23S rRNA (pseudouridine1915-N3)-methyltransferase